MKTCTLEQIAATPSLIGSLEPFPPDDDDDLPPTSRPWTCSPSSSFARASRAQLLAAWERVPAARRILELYGNAGQQTATEPLASHPLTADLFTDSSRSLHGAVGVASNIIFGRTSALQHAIENEEGRWSRL